MTKSKVTVYDIAREAGVSAATVSRVLTGNVPVQEKTREKVLEVLRKYDFRPSSVARSLKERRSRSIGFVAPDITNHYFSTMFLALELQAAQHGYTVILCNSNSDFVRESEILEVLLEKEVEAIVFTGGRIDVVGLPKKYVAEIERVNRIVPLVTCSVIPGAKCIQLINDERQGIFTLVKHLYDLGHREIGMIGGLPQNRPICLRRQHLMEAAEEYGLRVRDEWLIVEGGFMISAGSDCMEKMLALPQRPTAVMAFNDVVAVGALSALQRRGVRVPEDMALTGYDGVQITASVYPAITTAAADFAGYANRIMDLVLHRAEPGRVEEIMMPMELIARESTLGRG